jgi:hypothetical protein
MNYPYDLCASFVDTTETIEPDPMILNTFTLTLDPANPMAGTIKELRGFFAAKLAGYTELHKNDTTTFIYRYPVIQYKLIKNIHTVIGINEGAEVLRTICDESPEIRPGTETWRITGHSTGIAAGEFGIADTLHTYEFLTPWLPFSQENYKRFYKLKGKEERDGFVQKILVQNIGSLSKSLGYENPAPIRCDTNLHFQKDRIGDVTDMTFTGKFQANFAIPDLLGIGKSVSSGFGTLRQIPPK